MAKRKMTDEQITKAQDMRNKGMYYWKIGNVLHIPTTTVHASLNPQTREHNRLYALAYHKTHKVQESAYEKRRWHDHREREQTRFAEWYMNNKARDNKKSTEYRKAHLPEDANKHAVRRALLAGAVIGIAASQKAEITEIYRQAKESPRVRCYLCGKLIPKGHRHVDHIVPLSKGGTHRLSNLAVACNVCNMSKHDKIPEEVGLLL